MTSHRKHTLTRLALPVLASICLIGITGISLDGCTDNIFDADVAVVLGNLAYPEGPSEPLKARLDAALQLNKNNAIRYFFVSGGIDSRQTDEAKVMANYLIANGIDPNKIIEDNQGKNTRATAQNLSTWMNHNQLTSTIIVSQYFHISRTRLAFQQAGIKTIGNIHPSYFSIRDVISLPRELAGYLFYWLGIK